MNFSKLTTQYLYASALILILFCIIQFNPDKLIFMKRLRTNINFLYDFPDIKPDKCLKTGILYGGEKKAKYFSILPNSLLRSSDKHLC